MSDRDADHGVAVYQCHCGASVSVPKRYWAGLSFLSRKFGHRNIGSFIGHNKSCCDRPVYSSVDDCNPSQEDSQL